MRDVTIIGAGLAGLAAARRLQSAGLSVTVLEARSEAGGRARSAPGTALDLGPSWVWDSERHIHGLLRELGVETFPHHREGLDVYDDGRELQRGRLPRSAVEERRVAGGASAITDALSRDLRDLRLAHPVRAVALGEGCLRVETDAGDLRSRRVIAALPPARLARPVALPELPAERRQLLARVPTWMAEVAKVVAVYPERSWRARGLSGRAASAAGPMSELHDLSGPGGEPAALFGFVHRQLATPGWRERLVPQLARLFGAEAASPTALYVAAWWEERWAFAGGDNGDMRLFGHPFLREPLLEGRLHLASTETSGVSPGHMDGAVERAHAVADALIKRPDRP